MSIQVVVPAVSHVAQGLFRGRRVTPVDSVSPAVIDPVPCTLLACRTGFSRWARSAVPPSRLRFLRAAPISLVGTPRRWTAHPPSWGGLVGLPPASRSRSEGVMNA
jgi:hypothetical protein